MYVAHLSADLFFLEIRTFLEVTSRHLALERIESRHTSEQNPSERI